MLFTKPRESSYPIMLFNQFSFSVHNRRSFSSSHWNCQFVIFFGTDQNKINTLFAYLLIHIEFSLLHVCSSIKPTLLNTTAVLRDRASIISTKTLMFCISVLIDIITSLYKLYGQWLIEVIMCCNLSFKMSHSVMMAHTMCLRT